METEERRPEAGDRRPKTEWKMGKGERETMK